MRAIYRFFRNFAFVNTSLSKKGIIFRLRKRQDKRPHTRTNLAKRVDLRFEYDVREVEMWCEPLPFFEREVSTSAKVRKLLIITA